MKKLLFIGGFILLFASACTNCQREKKDLDDSIVQKDSSMVDDAADSTEMLQTITRFVRAYKSKDNAKANALIHPEIGLMITIRPGAIDWYEHVDSIDFSNPIPSFFPYQDINHSFSLAFEDAPTYDCGTETWSKKGFFCDTTNTTNILLPIADNLNEYEDVELDVNYKSAIEKAENGSYRVVLTTDIPLIFHVKAYEGKWYVTLLDRAYGDCSA